MTQLSTLYYGIDERCIRCEPGLLSGDGASRITGRRTNLCMITLLLRNGEGENAQGAGIVSLDLMGIDLEHSRRIRELVTGELPWLSESLIFACSHTHVAPSSMPAMHTYKQAFDSSIDQTAFDLEREFLNDLVADICASVKQAASQMQQGTLGFAKTDLAWLTFNRRRRTRDFGTISHWMGIPAHQAYTVEETIDPELTFFQVRDAAGEPQAILWNFAGHNSFYFGDEYSADLSEAVQSALDKAVGRHLPCLYTAGCGGDLNYHDYGVITAEGKHFGLEKAATAICDAIAALYRDLPALPEVQLKCERQVLDLAIRDIDQNWWADDVRRKLPGWTEASYIDREIAARQALGETRYETEMAVLRLGPWAIVTLPGEVFVEFALRIKAQAQLPGCMVIAYADDYAGYVASQQAFRNGSYEVWPALNAHIGPHGGETMAREACLMLTDLATEIN